MISAPGDSIAVCRWNADAARATSLCHAGGEVTSKQRGSTVAPACGWHSSRYLPSRLLPSHRLQSLISGPLPEMPSRSVRRAAVTVGTLAIAVALTVDVGLATGTLSGTAKADTSRPATGTGTATNYTLSSGSGNCSCRPGNPR